MDNGLRGPGSSPAEKIVLCSLSGQFTLTVPLYDQEYKLIPGNCQGNLTKCWGVTCDGLASHPGAVAISLVTSCYRNRVWGTRFVCREETAKRESQVAVDLHFNNSSGKIVVV